MTVSFGFYNSVAGDRVYDAVQVSQMFDGILTDGIFKLVGNKFEVIEDSLMDILVRSGKAWFNNTWTLNDGDISLEVSPSDLVLPRIDTVVLEVNSALASRTNTIKIIDGIPNASPIPPTLASTPELHQYPLAYVSVGAGVSSIVDANITQVVGTVDCPFITFPEPLPTDYDAANVLKVQVFT